MEKLYIPCTLKEDGRVRFNVKPLKLVALITLISVICVSIGAGYVQAANEATITASLSKYVVAPGEGVYVTVRVQSNVNQELKILYLGLHGDWMETDQFLGANLANNPATLAANDAYSGSFVVTLPSSISLGSHSYYIGVEAQDSSGSTHYSWNSAESAIQVTTSTSSTNPTTNPSGSGGEPTGTTDSMLYIAIVAIVVMVVLALLVLLTLRKRSRPKPAPQSVSSPPSQSPAPSPPEQQPPPEEKPSSGENFDI